MSNYGLQAPASWGNFGNYGTANTTGLQIDPNVAFSTGGDLQELMGQWQLPQFMQPTQAAGGQTGWLYDTGFLGKDGAQGWGGMALGALQGIGSAYMGMKQYGLAKDALAMQKDQFSKNYTAQQAAYNTQLEDRQRARVAATGGTAESVDSYMERNRIK